MSIPLVPCKSNKLPVVWTGNVLDAAITNGVGTVLTANPPVTTERFRISMSGPPPGSIIVPTGNPKVTDPYVTLNARVVVPLPARAVESAKNENASVWFAKLSVATAGSVPD